MLAPPVEAFGEPSRLFILQCEEQFPWLVRLHSLHVLYVYLNKNTYKHRLQYIIDKGEQDTTYTCLQEMRFQTPTVNTVKARWKG